MGTTIERTGLELSSRAVAGTAELKPRAMKVGIVGYGNTGHALACYLNNQGHAVSLLVRNLDKARRIQKEKTVRATGALEGVYSVQAITDNAADFCALSDTIFLATTADAYEEIVTQLARYLCRRHEIVLFSSKFGAAALVERVLAAHGVSGVSVVETDALFDTRTQADDSVWIRGLKKWTLYSGACRSRTRAYAPIIERYFSGLEPADNLVQRGLTDFGAVAHAVISMANISKIDQAMPFAFYYEGLSRHTICLLEAMESEFHALAEAYTTSILPMKEVLNRYYGCDTSSLLSAVTSVPNYKHSVGPTTLNHRFLKEDVGCTLIPAQQLARLAGLSTPMMDAIITFSGLLTGTNFQKEGRTLEQLGLGGLTQQEIITVINS